MQQKDKLANNQKIYGLVCEKFVNKGDLGFLEGDWSKMGERWQLCKTEIQIHKQIK